MILKANLATLLAVLCIVATSLAQNNPVQELSAEEYKARKLAGTLVPTTVPAKSIFPSFDPAAAAQISNNDGPTPVINAGGACGCYTPHDNTWEQVTIADFNNQSDDGSAGPYTLPFPFCFYGDSITDYYININGNVSFGTSYSWYSANAFPDSEYVMVAPFWADVDLGGANNGTVWVDETPTHLRINWEAVGYFPEQTDKVNTFSLVITDGTDPLLPPGQNVGFCYQDMQWTTGSASGGTNGFGGAPATVGANKGDGDAYIQFGRFDTLGIGFDGPFDTADGIDWLDNKSFVFDVCASTNIPPIVTGLDLCDTIRVCVDDTISFDLSILSPEDTQITVAIIDTVGLTLTNYNVLSNSSGVSADVDVEIITTVADMGIHTFTITAWDNGTPPDTIYIDVIISVDSLPAVPEITGDTLFCDGDSVVLSVQNVFEDYFWSDGQVDASSITVTQGGLYTVHTLVQGCETTSDALLVTELPNPSPTVLGATHYCYLDSATLEVQQPAQYDSIHWSDGTQGPTALLGTGTYNVTVWDPAIGCPGTYPDFTVTQSGPTPEILPTARFCPGEETFIGVLDTNAVLQYNYDWVFGPTTPAVSVPDGVYSLNVTDAFNCDLLLTWTLAADPLPVPEFEIAPSTFSWVDESVAFTDQSTSDGGAIVSWYWDFGDGTLDSTQNPTHIYTEEGIQTIQLTTVTEFGCTNTAGFPYRIARPIEATNVITPNSDGFNDQLVFRNLDLFPNTKLSIYDRWGGRVENFTNYQNDWKADKRKDGVYYYVLEVPGLEEPITGYVHVFREGNN